MVNMPCISLTSTDLFHPTTIDFWPTLGGSCGTSFCQLGWLVWYGEICWMGWSSGYGMDWTELWHTSIKSLTMCAADTSILEVKWRNHLPEKISIHSVMVGWLDEQSSTWWNRHSYFNGMWDDLTSSHSPVQNGHSQKGDMWGELTNSHPFFYGKECCHSWWACLVTGEL
jgi:hypothetical protein